MVPEGQLIGRGVTRGRNCAGTGAISIETSSAPKVLKVVLGRGERNGRSRRCVIIFWGSDRRGWLILVHPVGKNRVRHTCLGGNGAVPGQRYYITGSWERPPGTQDLLVSG